jgi:Putative restriction endonuclease
MDHGEDGGLEGLEGEDGMEHDVVIDVAFIGAIHIPFYAIYEVEKASVEVYQLIGDRYQPCEPNDRGHYPIPSLGVELGIWQGRYMNQALPWLRWWDAEGNLLLAGDERAQKEAARSQKLAAKLRELGVNPDDL